MVQYSANQDVFIRDRCKMVWNKEEENKFGQMEVIMKENGLMIKLMVLEDLYILMEMSMKEIGAMILVY